MDQTELKKLLFATFVAFCALYAPQPILPRLALEFAISPSDASLLISATLIPLGLAPIFYGYLIEAVPARLLLLSALAVLIVGQLIFATAESYGWLLTSRVLQGLSFPAALTAIMTYCSTNATSGSTKRIIGYYIATTIFGGFAGRLISGIFASTAGWRYTFFSLAAALSIAWILLYRQPRDGKVDFAKLDIKSIKRVLYQARYRHGLLTIFFVFFTFASMLNALPFHLKDIDPSINDFTISLVYAGYLIGVIVTLQSARLSRFIGSEIRVVQIGIMILGLSTAAYSISNTYSSIFLMITFAAGMFMVHSILSAHLNHSSLENKGVVNGLYISFYYAGGAIGSWLPSLIYKYAGWYVLIAVLFTSCITGLFFSEQLKRAEETWQ